MSWTSPDLCHCGADATEVWIRTPIGTCVKWVCAGHVNGELDRLRSEWGQAKVIDRPVCKDDKLT